MTDMDVKIIKLEKMRMLSAYGFGTEPEGIAWEKLKTFLRESNLFKEGEFPSTYGFNNPNPVEGLPEYGYEIWFPVDKGVKPRDDLRIVDFYGGLYATTAFKGLHNIGQVWESLWKWRESSDYKPGFHQWLEELTSGPDLPLQDYAFNLYLPIVE